MALENVEFFGVESSNVESFGYDEEEGVLYVRFLEKPTQPSRLYAYYEVEPEIFDQFFAAESKGRFIWTHLRGRYEYQEII